MKHICFVASVVALLSVAKDLHRLSLLLMVAAIWRVKRQETRTPNKETP